MAVKTIKKPRVKSLDEAVILMLESIAESNKRTDRIIAESRVETDRKMAESRAETDKKMAESRVETDRKISESEAKRDEAIERMAEKIDKLSDSVAEVLSGLSTVGNRLGDIVELVVIPGLRRAINAHGHDFKRSTANKSFSYIGRSGQKQGIAEVDMFLSNGTEAMAVEIKATLTAGYVNKHLQQLKRLREFEKETRLEGKKLYGAVVGVYVDRDARKLALKNGLYVIEILEEEKKLKTDAPAKCHVW